jgi:SulP family sulfate permease
MSPQAGIYCAIVTGIIISTARWLLRSDRWPTGAFVVVVAGIVAQLRRRRLFMCTMMAGVLLVIMGLTGTGTAVRFISAPGGDRLYTTASRW